MSNGALSSSSRLSSGDEPSGGADQVNVAGANPPVPATAAGTTPLAASGTRRVIVKRDAAAGSANGGGAAGASGRGRAEVVG